MMMEALKNLSPDEKHLMGLNPNTNGGLLLKELKVPSYKKYALKIKTPGEVYASDMLELGKFIKDIVKLNPDNFRIFGPDEALSNRLNHVFEVTNRSFDGRILKTDEYLSPDGRIIDSILSEISIADETYKVSLLSQLLAVWSGSYSEIRSCQRKRSCRLETFKMQPVFQWWI